MSRKSTGTVRIIGGRWHAKWTRADGSRSPWTPLPGSIPLDDRAKAKSEAARLAPSIRVAQVTAAGPVETVEGYAGRWLDDREGRVNSIRDDRARMRKHVLPVLGTLDARTFGRDDVERLRDGLDDKIVAGKLAWKTVASVWTLVTSMCSDMVSAKKREFRIRDDNPCRDVKAPERGERKAKQYLYPSEFLQFVSCERVPLRWRRAVAVAVYTFVRDGELRALRWDGGDIDLPHGVLSVTRAYNKNARQIDSTKSGETRRFAIEPALMPLLEVMHGEALGRGPVVSVPSDRAIAHRFRLMLRKAGVTRPELHDGSPTRKPLTWHDLRATGLTWMAVRGDDPLKIKQRAGHATFQTTELYIREGEAVREGFGDPFPTLPSCLLSNVHESSGTFEEAAIQVKTSPIAVRRAGLELSKSDEPDPAENKPDRAPYDVTESTRAPGVRDHSLSTLVTTGEIVSEADLERAIVQAVMAGLGDVAKTLAAQLEERRRASTPDNVVRLDARKGR